MTSVLVIEDNAGVREELQLLLGFEGFEVAPIENRLRVRITDRGRGMTPEQMESIAPYEQFDRSVFEQQGMGLGLSVARLLASFYGGGLDFEAAPGGGTTVTLTLPLVDAAQSLDHAAC